MGILDVKENELLALWSFGERVTFTCQSRAPLLGETPSEAIRLRMLYISFSRNI